MIKLRLLEPPKKCNQLVNCKTMGYSLKNRILYVEDNEDTRVLVEYMLADAGYEVVTAATGEQAFEIYTGGEHFDLFLLNNSYSDMSGVSLCQAIREKDKETPILFYSGRALAKEKVEGLEAGANAYLIKPDDTPDLSDHITKWIKLSKKENFSANAG